MTDGTWREHDPADTDAADGIAEIKVPVKDIMVNLATDADRRADQHGRAGRSPRSTPIRPRARS